MCVFSTNQSVGRNEEPLLIQGSVNGGFQTVVRVLCGNEIPLPPFDLNLIPFLPQFYLNFTSFLPHFYLFNLNFTSI